MFDILTSMLHATSQRSDLLIVVFVCLCTFCTIYVNHFHFYELLLIPLTAWSMTSVLLTLLITYNFCAIVLIYIVLLLNWYIVRYYQNVLHFWGFIACPSRRPGRNAKVFGLPFNKCELIAMKIGHKLCHEAVGMFCGDWCRGAPSKK